MSYCRTVYAASLICLSLAAPVGAQPEFVGLGDLPGGAFSSTAWRTSADGTTVTGWSESANGTEAFRWTQATGMQGVGDLPGCAFNSFGGGISQDGSVIGGGGESTASCDGDPDDPNEWEPFRWTEAGGMVALGDLPGGGYYGYVNGVSSDGSLLVGWSGATVGSSTSDHAFLLDAGNRPAASARDPRWL